MDLMEPVKLDLNRSRACSRCAFCAFLRLCLSSYVAQRFGRIPRACPVECHVRGYSSESLFPGCHGLVPWRFTPPELRERPP
jgi:hypothetical protein